MAAAWLPLGVVFGIFALASCDDSSGSVPFAGLPPTTGSASLPPREPPPSPEPPPSAVAGSWAMHSGSDTDFIAVQLSQVGSTLGGFGCISGLPDKAPIADYVATQCGAIVGGRVDGRRVQLRYAGSFGSGWTIAADAFVSLDGRRMAGRFVELLVQSDAAPPSWRDAPTAWFPINPEDVWLRSTKQWPADFSGWPELRAYRLMLLDDATGGAEFSRDKPYSFEIHMGTRKGIAGDLGSFWIDELSFAPGPSGETTTITAGPVSETAPTLPVELKVGLQDATVVQVDARTPSGATYRFSASEAPR